MDEESKDSMGMGATFVSIGIRYYEWGRVCKKVARDPNATRPMQLQFAIAQCAGSLKVFHKWHTPTNAIASISI